MSVQFDYGWVLGALYDPEKPSFLCTGRSTGTRQDIGVKRQNKYMWGYRMGTKINKQNGRVPAGSGTASAPHREKQGRLLRNERVMYRLLCLKALHGLESNIASFPIFMRRGVE